MGAEATLSRRVVIVGNGMAGTRLAAELGRTAPDVDVTILGAEPYRAYNRILLSSVLAGERALDDIYLDGTRASLHTGEAVAGIERERRIVTTASGREVAYDVLVLATGSAPIVLPVPGAALPGVVTFRDIADVERMTANAGAGRRAVVIGGGLLGLEAAEGLRCRGMTVSVVHLMPSLMERQLDAEGGRVLQAALERRGLQFLMATETAAILGDAVVTGIRLKDGRELPADLVVMAAGVRPNIGLAQKAGLACGRGVQVDDALRTSDPAIYAIGDCLEHRGRCYGLVEPITAQAEIGARQIAGDMTARYAGSVEATSLKVSGIALYSAGQQSAGAGDEEVVLRDPQQDLYRKLIMRGDRLTGAILLGDTTDGAWYGDLIRGGASIGAMRGDLVFGRRFVDLPLAA